MWGLRLQIAAPVKPDASRESRALAFVFQKGDCVVHVGIYARWLFGCQQLFSTTMINSFPSWLESPGREVFAEVYLWYAI